LKKRLGVTESSIWNWEAGHSHPNLRYLPAIIAFLGYTPLPEAKTLGERLVRHRKTLGMSQKEAAHQLGVDPGTLARWERGEREPAGDHLVEASPISRRWWRPPQRTACRLGWKVSCEDLPRSEFLHLYEPERRQT